LNRCKQASFYVMLDKDKIKAVCRQTKTAFILNNMQSIAKSIFLVKQQNILFHLSQIITQDIGIIHNKPLCKN